MTVIYRRVRLRGKYDPLIWKAPQAEECLGLGRGRSKEIDIFQHDLRGTLSGGLVVSTVKPVSATSRSPSMRILSSSR